MLTAKQTELVYLRHCNGGSRNYSSAEMLHVEKLSRLILDRFQGKEIRIFSSPESEATLTSEVIASLLGVVSITKHQMLGNKVLCASLRAQNASRFLLPEMDDSRLIVIVSHHEMIRNLPDELQDLASGKYPDLILKPSEAIRRPLFLKNGEAFIHNLSLAGSIEPLLV